MNIKSPITKIKKYPCFTVEQQQAYERLNPRQRAYVDIRGKGHNKTNAYKLAGFSSKNATQAAYLLEMHNKQIPELIEAITGQKRVRDLTVQDSQINQQIDALATKEGAEALVKVIEGDDSEKARQIQFYRDIIIGKIKTVRKTTKYNAVGEKMSCVVEEVSDVEVRMKARKELDRILGVNDIIGMGQLQVGNMTINIVDSAKHEELEDSRNTIRLDPEDMQIIDGEQALVVEEKEEREKPKPEVTVTEAK